MLFSSHKEILSLTFLENELYYSKTDIQGESDNSEYRLWDFEFIPPTVSPSTMFDPLVFVPGLISHATENQLESQQSQPLIEPELQLLIVPSTINNK